MKIKVWKLLVALVLLLVLVFWFKVVHQNDEILALIRNEVVTGAAGQRTWVGSFVNTNDKPWIRAPEPCSNFPGSVRFLPWKKNKLTHLG